jgi:hypothetical protein
LTALYDAETNSTKRADYEWEIYVTSNNISNLNERMSNNLADLTEVQAQYDTRLEEQALQT